MDASEHKAKGNEAYQAGRFQDAIAAYTAGVAWLDENPGAVQAAQQGKGDEEAEARALAAAAAAGDLQAVNRLLTPSGRGAVDPVRSALLANRAQARLQLRDLKGVVEDCSGALWADSSNVKALVRQPVCRSCRRLFIR